MRMSGLSFESMPPLFIPLRFFLTAPFFGILASLLFLFDAQLIHSSRWSGETLAITHLLTLGFMLMSMTGAMFQFIPVITGYAIPASKHITSSIYFSLIFGSLFLTAGFLTQKVVFFQFALFFLAVVLVVFIGSLSYLLITLKSKKEAVFVLRLVDVSLLITLVLGLFMTMGYSFNGLGIAYREYTDLHLMWGLVGWTILLILAVSSQVIPMFHVAPAFPALYLKILSVFIMLCLMSLTLLVLTDSSDQLIKIADFSLSFGILVYAFYSLFMINKRKRKVKDITINFWRLALTILILVVALYWSNALINQYYVIELELLLGLLFIFGFAISCIIGMMQKIVPFIIYMHLQRKIMLKPTKMGLLPNMQSLISVKNQQVQLYLHILTLLLMSLSIVFNSVFVLSLLAAVMMFLNFSWLAYNLYYSSKQYWLISQQLEKG
ncbi:MAG: hypothetical protein QM479_01890 [Pseudomonadota bacterium]